LFHGKISRRDFIKGGGIIIASASLMGSFFPYEKILAAPPSPFGEEDIPRLLSLAMNRGGDFAEIYFEDSRSKFIKMQENKIESTQIGYSRGAGIRVLSGEKTGYAYSDDLSSESLSQAAEVASNIANGSGSDKSYSVTPVVAPDYYSVEIYPDQVDINKKLEIIQRANEFAFSCSSKVKNVRIGYSESSRDIMVASTEGIIAKDRQNALLLWVFITVEEGDKKQTCFYGDGGRTGFEFFNTFTPESIVKIAVDRALINLEAYDAPAGPMDVVLEGRYGAILLHEAIGHGMEADFNRKNLSAYSGRLGEEIAIKAVNIYDDGSIDPKQSGTINIDDEGSAGRRTVLVEEGVLKNYMQDILNSRSMGMALTGNGRRESFQCAPIPRMTNTVMGKGEYVPEEIISSVEKGFYAKAMTNGQVDISSGDFMFYVDEGYMIEKGKITKPVKGATLTGNGPEVLARITMVGNDFSFAPCYFTCGKDGQSVPVGFGMPTVKITDLTVGGTNV